MSTGRWDETRLAALRRTGRSSVGRAWLPAGVVLAVIALDVATGSRAVALSLVCVAPLLASSLLPPRATAAYGVLALVTGAALGAYAGLYSAGPLGDQVVRLATITIAGLMAVGAAAARVRREERLVRVQRIAAAVQAAVLPPVPERLGPLRLAASYDSAEQEAAIGGDVYAAVPSPFGERLLIADVRGHGLDAVRLATTVLGAFRERAHERASLCELAGDLDRAVDRAAGPEDFVTAVLLQLTEGRLQVVNAAHPPPLLLRRGVVSALDPRQPSLPLGLGATPEVLPVALEPGDRLLLYTDGVVEARHVADGSAFPLLSLAGPLLVSGSVDDGLQRVRQALADWTGGARDDDVTLLALEYAPG